MIRSSIIFSLFFICSLAAAQEDYAVSMQGDTLFGKIKVYLSGPTGNSLVIKAGKKNVSLSPYEYTEVTNLGKYTFRSVVLNRRRYFMKEVVTGHLSLYDFNFSELNSTSVVYEQVIHEQGSLAEIVRNIGFSKHLEKYLKHCPSLVASLANSKKYKKKNLAEFVEDYNDCIEKDGIKKPIVTEVAKKTTSNIINETIEVIQDQENFDKKEALLEILNDMNKRISNGEKIPDYLWPIVTNYASENQSAATAIEDLKKGMEELANRP